MNAIKTPVRPRTRGKARLNGSGTMPVYELRRIGSRGGAWRFEIWQLPSPSTPRLKTSERVATLKGKPLRLVETRVLKQLARSGIRLSGSVRAGQSQSWPLDEDLALTLGLLFRVLAPMHNLDRIRQVAEGVQAMSREEAGYWLGMAMHRKFPRRVLAALRMLLTMP